MDGSHLISLLAEGILLGTWLFIHAHAVRSAGRRFGRRRAATEPPLARGWTPAKPQWCGRRSSGSRRSAPS